MSPHLTFEPLEVMVLAAGAIDLILQLADFETAEFVVPDIDINQFPIDSFDVAGEYLQGFRRLKAGYDINGRRQHARGFAGGSHARGWAGFHYAAQAWRLAGNDRHGLADAADSSTVDPGLVQLDRCIIDQVADFEVIGAIKHQVDILHEVEDVGMVDIGHDGFDRDLGVNAAELAGSSLCLGNTCCDIIFIEENLPLQVMVFDEIAINDANKANASPDERVGQHRTQRTATTERDPAGEQLLLPRFADTMKPHLPAVTFHLIFHI